MQPSQSRDPVGSGDPRKSNRTKAGTAEQKVPSSAPLSVSPLEARARLALAIAALGLAAIGQYHFSFVRANLASGVLFFLAAIAFYLILIRRSEKGLEEGRGFTASAQRVLGWIRNEPIKAVLVGLSFALAYTTIQVLKAKPGPGSYWDVFFLWVLSFVVYAAAFVERPRFGITTWVRSNFRELVTVLALTAIAAGLRFIALGRIPNVINGDEGVIGTMAVQVLDGELRNMMAVLYGISTFYLFILAAIIKLFGQNPLGLRLLSAVGGALTVPALYLLARTLFNSRVALVAASLLAVSHFHVHFSRLIVATSIQDALLATLALFFFYTGLQKRSVQRLVISALLLGFGLYVYMGARLMILMLPVYLLVLLALRRQIVLENRAHLIAAAGALIVIAAPMLYFALSRPADFMSRVNQLGILQSGWLAQEAAKTGVSSAHILLDQFQKALLTINYYPAHSFYFARLPMLDQASSALFVLGLAYALYRSRDPRYLLLNGWFWSGILVAGALFVVPQVSAYRMMIIFPAVCLIVALAWDRLVEFGASALPGFSLPTRALTALLIAVLAILNLKAYWFDFAGGCTFENSNTRLASYIGSYMSRLGPGYAPYMLTSPRVHYGTYRSIAFLSAGTPVTEIEEPLHEVPTYLDPSRKAVFFFSPEREGELAFVQARLSGGEVDRVFDCDDVLMIVYVVPGSGGLSGGSDGG
jgi:4-amino-4-deoxy-L-arabinose transferase-like glycosyltransferase